MMVRKGLVDSFVGGATYTTADVCRAEHPDHRHAAGAQDPVQLLRHDSPRQVLRQGRHPLLRRRRRGHRSQPRAAGRHRHRHRRQLRQPDGRSPARGHAVVLDQGQRQARAHRQGHWPRRTLVKKRRPELIIDGELQGDAALIPGHRREARPRARRWRARPPSSSFPISTPATSATSSPSAWARPRPSVPSLQGMAKPSSDLSRGCKATDIVNVIAINVVRLQFAQK